LNKDLLALFVINILVKATLSPNTYLNKDLLAQKAIASKEEVQNVRILTWIKICWHIRSGATIDQVRASPNTYLNKDLLALWTIDVDRHNQVSEYLLE